MLNRKSSVVKKMAEYMDSDLYPYTLDALFHNVFFQVLLDLCWAGAWVFAFHLPWPGHKASIIGIHSIYMYFLDMLYSIGLLL